MNGELVKAMEEFCIRVLKGGPDIQPQETCSMPKVLAILERMDDYRDYRF